MKEYTDILRLRCVVVLGSGCLWCVLAVVMASFVGCVALRVHHLECCACNIYLLYMCAIPRCCVLFIKVILASAYLIIFPVGIDLIVLLSFVDCRPGSKLSCDGA